jgi:hypothetical protein
MKFRYHKRQTRLNGFDPGLGGVKIPCSKGVMPGGQRPLPTSPMSGWQTAIRFDLELNVTTGTFFEKMFCHVLAPSRRRLLHEMTS